MNTDFSCADISRHIYQRALEEGENPYFTNNRHFSIAGTRIVAESFVAQAKETPQPGRIDLVGTAFKVVRWQVAFTQKLIINRGGKSLDMKNVEHELIATALPYWETEAAIVRRFFRSKPTREDHIFWLKAQLWKELHPVDGYFTGLQKELNNLVANFPKIDKTIGRHQYHALLEQLTQEFNHYVLMADVLEYLLGHPVSADDTFQLPQEKKLGDIRRAYANSGSAVDKAAVLVTEGGGARMFREGRKLRGGRLEGMIAGAMEDHLSG